MRKKLSSLILALGPLIATFILALIGYCNPAVARVSSTDTHISNRFPGENTTLIVDWTGPLFPVHDSTYDGKTTFTLLSPDKSVLFKKELDNSKFRFLTYSHERHAFVLVGQGEIGVKLGVAGVDYIPEKQPAFVNSSFNSKNYVAYKVMPGPDGRFVVFIGCVWNGTPQLYVLDTKSDKIHLLGEPPAPRPDNKENWAYQERENGGAPWDWDNPFANEDDLEPDICQFVSPHILRCSYGHDTYKHRSKHRRIRIWNLNIK